MAIFLNTVSYFMPCFLISWKSIESLAIYGRARAPKIFSPSTIYCFHFRFTQIQIWPTRHTCTYGAIFDNFITFSIKHSCFPEKRVSGIRLLGFSHARLFFIIQIDCVRLSDQDNTKIFKIGSLLRTIEHFYSFKSTKLSSRSLNKDPISI